MSIFEPDGSRAVRFLIFDPTEIAIYSEPSVGPRQQDKPVSAVHLMHQAALSTEGLSLAGGSSGKKSFGVTSTPMLGPTLMMRRICS